MSRKVVNDHPLTLEEVEYLLARGQEYMVNQNMKDFPPQSEKSSPAPQLDDDIFQTVKAMTDDEVLDQIRDRRLDASGEMKTLKLRLAQALQAEKDAE